ncbi:DUF4232 domain-containing protein [Streptomyces tanashiensis]|uniref:DUF4232 domain-containing protein n=1 Tax=Streptomyces tanashiensis TaxID=67367 RepID=A0ABY6QWH1_9ACTN|nr:DUF4232 domain-containing protein [Streptomyces tanashiensis]UZX21012.1 DUF4232 domain-containing protein [Streptomyces tanashiensis]
MRAARTSWKTYALGAAAVAAMLSATACGPDGTEDGAASPAPSGTASASASESVKPTAPSPSDSAKPSASASESAKPKPSATGSGKPGGGDSKGRARACADQDLSIDTSYWAHDSGQHLLITATNATDTPCTLYAYPFLYFGQETENPLPPMESPPKAVATIGPKQKAYAGVKLFLGGEKTDTYESFGIAYKDPSSSTDGAAIDVSLSDDVRFVTVGQNPSVTFWNLDRREVEKFVFKAR